MTNPTMTYSAMNAPFTSSNLFLGTQELPADVILHILNDLRKIQHLANLRVVSKQFDALIAPLIYRHVNLTDRILVPFAFEQELYDPSIVHFRVVRDVRVYTRHLTISRSLEWSLVAKLIKSLENLWSFTWAFWGPEATSLSRSASSIIGPVLCEAWPNVELRFEGVRSSTYRPCDYSDFPNSNLVTCKVAAWETAQLPMIHGLLFQRPRLQELRLVHQVSGPLAFPKSKIEVHGAQFVDCLPALRTLVIDGYSSKYSPWGNTNLWNWSNITHLELKDVQVIEFLYRVPPQSLSRLRTLIEQCTFDEMPHNPTRKSTMLCSLVMHATALEDLRIKCNTQESEIISTIARNGPHLHTLNVQCFSLHIKSLWTPLTVDQLTTIGSSCPHLMEMQVDLALPTMAQKLSAVTRSVSENAATPASTIMTRSTSRVHTAKRDPNDIDQDDSENEKVGKSVSQRAIRSWYTDAYVEERYQPPGYVGMRRIECVEETAKDQGIGFDKVDNEFMIWKRNQRRAEIAALRNQVHADPTSALAGFRNLRRLVIFTRINYFVPQSDNIANSTTRKAVKAWVNGLLLTKEGASFEKVTVHVRTEVVNEEIHVRTQILESTHTYAGRRTAAGKAEIREDIGMFTEGVSI